MLCLRNDEGKRGQVFSYDVLGSIVIFMIGLGILIAHWTSVSTVRNDVVPSRVSDVNVHMDNLMREGMLLKEDGISINVSKFNDCDSLKLSGNYVLSVIDSNTKLVCGNPPKKHENKYVSERIALKDGRVVKVRLEYYE